MTRAAFDRISYHLWSMGREELLHELCHASLLNAPTSLFHSEKGLEKGIDELIPRSSKAADWHEFNTLATELEVARLLHIRIPALSALANLEWRYFQPRCFGVKSFISKLRAADPCFVREGRTRMEWSRLLRGRRRWRRGRGRGGLRRGPL